MPGRVLFAAALLCLSACEEKRAENQEETQATSTSVADSPKPPGKVASFAASARVVLLGTGTPVPDPDRSGPATAVVFGGHAYLVDSGPGLVRRAEAARRRGVEELAVEKLDRVFVTHLHSDHTAGLADLILTPRVVGRLGPLAIYGPPGIGAMARHVLAAHEVDLAVRYPDRSMDQVQREHIAIHEITGGEVYRTDGLKVSAFAVAHGDFEHAFGYRFEAGGRAIVVSGDTGPTDAVAKACAGCDVLVHEVYCEAGLQRVPPAARRYHGSFHTSGPALGRIAVQARPKLLVLTHLLPFGCSEGQMLDEVRGAFGGEVVVGEDLGTY